MAKDVSDTFHLQRRGGTWYYFRRVPTHLVVTIGKTFIKHSLGVTDKAAAKKLRTIEDLKTEALFAALEQGVGADPGLNTISIAALIDAVRKNVTKRDECSSQQFMNDPPASAEELADMRKDAEIEYSILSNPGDPRREDLAESVGRRILKQINAQLENETQEAEFFAMVRRGLIEVNRRKRDRYDNRYDHAFYDEMFAPHFQQGVCLQDIATAFLAEKTQEYKLNSVSQKRIDKIIASVATIREIVGGHTFVHQIDDDLVQQVRAKVAALPANRIKLYPNLSIDKAIERAAKDGKPTLAFVTQRLYLDTFRDLLKFAVRKKFITSNPAAEIAPLKKETVANHEKRKPWSKEQIAGFFSGAFYRRCAGLSGEPYTKPDRDWRFWLPLIMLLSGARPNEICQLNIVDIQCTEAGVWFMNMLDDEDGKSLKTETSRRRVPIHIELIRIGFLKFVDRRRKAKDSPRLFPMLKPNKYGNLAWYPAKRLNEDFIPAEIDLQDRQSLYSLRHNVRDALRRIKAPADTLRAIAGWAQGNKTVSDDYGDPGNPDLHTGYVDKIAYSGLDLSFLHGVEP